jgi:hypothetical protein
MGTGQLHRIAAVKRRKLGYRALHARKTGNRARLCLRHSNPQGNSGANRGKLAAHFAPNHELDAAAYLGERTILVMYARRRLSNNRQNH